LPPQIDPDTLATTKGVKIKSNGNGANPIPTPRRMGINQPCENMELWG